MGQSVTVPARAVEHNDARAWSIMVPTPPSIMIGARIGLLPKQGQSESFREIWNPP